MAGAQLDIKIVAHDMASSVVSKVGGIMDGLGRAGLAIGGLKAIAEGIGSVATSMIDGNAKMETYETQLGTLLGSTDAAKERIAQLSKIGAETPFELSQLVAAEKIMAGFGLTTEKTQKLTGLSLDEYRTRMGDMAAATGTDLSEVTLLWSKFGSGATGEAISRLQELGIVTREQMQEMGIQFSKSGELTSPIPEAMRVALEIANQKMGGGMKALSATFEGQMSTLSDNFNQAKILLMAPIFDVLKAGLTSVNELLSSGVFQEGLTAFATGFADAIRATIAVVQDLWDVFQGGDSFDGAASVLDKFLPPAAVDFILEATRQIGDAWRTVVQVFTEGWEPSAEIEPLANALGGVALVIRDIVIPAVLEVAGFMVSQFGGVVEWVTENWPLIQETIATVLAAIAAFWREHGSTIIAVVQSAWTIVSTVISTSIQTVLGVIRTVMLLIKGDWSGAWREIMDVVGTILSGITTIIGAIVAAWWAVLDDATGGMLTSVSSWLSNMANAISSAFQGIYLLHLAAWNAIVDTVGSIIPAIYSVVMTMWNALPADIRADLEAIASDISSLGAIWVANITTAGSGMLTAITTALGEMVAAVVTWASATFLAPLITLAGTAQTATISVGAGMYEGIVGKLAEIVGAVQSWASSTFIAPLQGLVETARGIASSIGSAIVDGVTGAIRSGASAVTGAIRGIISGALAAAQADNEIHSPSEKWYRELGAPLGQGVALGIVGMAGAAAAAATQLVSTAGTAANRQIDALTQRAQAMAEAARQAAERAAKAKTLRQIEDITGDLFRAMTSRSETLPIPAFTPQPVWGGENVAIPPLFRPAPPTSVGGNGYGGSGGGSQLGRESINIYIGEHELGDWFVEEYHRARRRGRLE